MRVLFSTLLAAAVSLATAVLTPASAAPAYQGSTIEAPALLEKATYGYGYGRGWRHRGYGWDGGYGYRPYYGYGYRRHWRPRYYGYGYRRGWRRDYW